MKVVFSKMLLIFYVEKFEFDLLEDVDAFIRFF